MSEVVNETNVVEQTDDVMPTPQTMNYEQKVKLTDKFVDDVVNSLGELAYAETHEVIDFVKNNKDGLPINLANQLLNKLATYPYNVINSVMHNIETDQTLYFVLETPVQQE